MACQLKKGELIILYSSLKHFDLGPVAHEMCAGDEITNVLLTVLVSRRNGGEIVVNCFNDFCGKRVGQPGRGFPRLRCASP